MRPTVSWKSRRVGSDGKTFCPPSLEGLASLRACPQLTTLQLQGTQVTDAGLVELKGMKQLDPQLGDVVAILGQGPVGLIFTMMAAREGVRLAPGSRFGNDSRFERRLRLPFTLPVDSLLEAVRRLAVADGRVREGGPVALADMIV